VIVVHVMRGSISILALSSSRLPRLSPLMLAISSEMAFRKLAGPYWDLRTLVYSYAVLDLSCARNDQDALPLSPRLAHSKTPPPTIPAELEEPFNPRSDVCAGSVSGGIDCPHIERPKAITLERSAITRRKLRGDCVSSLHPVTKNRARFQG